MVNAQTWLDNKYPKKEERKNIKKIFIAVTNAAFKFSGKNDISDDEFYSEYVSFIKTPEKDRILLNNDEIIEGRLKFENFTNLEWQDIISIHKDY